MQKCDDRIKISLHVRWIDAHGLSNVMYLYACSKAVFQMITFDRCAGIPKVIIYNLNVSPKNSKMRRLRFALRVPIHIAEIEQWLSS